MTIFQGMRRRMTKMNSTFSMGNVVPNTTALKFFPKKPSYRLNESQETSFRARIIVSKKKKKKKGFILVWLSPTPATFLKPVPTF